MNEEKQKIIQRAKELFPDNELKVNQILTIIY